MQQEKPEVCQQPEKSSCATRSTVAAAVPLLSLLLVQHHVLQHHHWGRHHRDLGHEHGLRMLSTVVDRCLLVIVVLVASLTQPPALCNGLRCYTDIGATKSSSVECGLNTGCVKVYIDTEEMQLRKQAEYGYGYGFNKAEGVPPLPERYLGDPVLKRGCFVLAVPDRCYNARDGKSYCWCSQKDLCNSANKQHQQATFHGFQLSFILAFLWPLILLVPPQHPLAAVMNFWRWAIEEIYPRSPHQPPQKKTPLWKIQNTIIPI